MSSEPVSPADTPDYEAIRLRAQAQLSHFGTGTGTGVPSCDRCGKPTNRWDEPCDYMQTAAALLAEDVRALLAVGERDKAELERLRATLESQIRVCELSQAAEVSFQEAGERDRQHIARLTEALIRLVNYLGAVGAAEDDAIHELVRQARAVLADKEDARP